MNLQPELPGLVHGCVILDLVQHHCFLSELQNLNQHLIKKTSLKMEWLNWQHREFSALFLDFDTMFIVSNTGWTGKILALTAAVMCLAQLFCMQLESWMSLTFLHWASQHYCSVWINLLRGMKLQHTERRILPKYFFCLLLASAACCFCCFIKFKTK